MLHKPRRLCNSFGLSLAAVCTAGLFGVPQDLRLGVDSRAMRTRPERIIILPRTPRETRGLAKPARKLADTHVLQETVTNVARVQDLVVLAPVLEPRFFTPG